MIKYSISTKDSVLDSVWWIGVLDRWIRCFMIKYSISTKDSVLDSISTFGVVVQSNTLSFNVPSFVFNGIIREILLFFRKS